MPVLTKKLLDKKLSELYFGNKSPVQFARKELVYKELIKVLNKQSIDYNTKVLKSWVNEWFEEKEPHALHEPVFRKFDRFPITVKGKGSQLQLDLVDLSKYAVHNEGTEQVPGSRKRQNVQYKFLLTIIDVFSKKGWGYKAKGKQASELYHILREFLEDYHAEMGSYPRKIHTDKGGEFRNKMIQNLLMSKKIKLFHTDNPEIKGSVVERWNQTLMKALHKHFTHERQKLKERAKKSKRTFDEDDMKYNWTDVIDQIIENYNNRWHKSLKMSPNEVNDENEVDIIKQRVIQNQYRCYDKTMEKKKTYEIGEKVFYSYAKSTVGGKSYVRQWSDKVTVITKRYREGNIWAYELKYLKTGEKLQGRFYHHELKRTPKKYFLTGKPW